jgi:hypothetical protein
MGLRVAPSGLRADSPGVGCAVAHRCAHRLTVVGIGRRRQGNRGGRDAGNYRCKDHVIHRSRPQQLTSRKGRTLDGRTAFLDGFLTQPEQMSWEPNLFRLPQLLGPLLQSGLLLLGASLA